jgi:glycosyltransferase involved in cell wall biosynthesis
MFESNVPSEFHSVQVILASLNEEIGIRKTIEDLKQNLPFFKLLVVDGKSNDRTVEYAKDEGAEVIYQTGEGKGDAIACAIKHSDLQADYFVFIDADYTYPAKYIPPMLDLLEKNPDVGMVCGDRLSCRMNSKIFHGAYFFGNKLIALTHSILNGVKLNDPLTGLRVIRADLLRYWQVQAKGFDIEVDLNQYVKQTGFQIREIPITYRERLGEKKLKPLDAAVIVRSMLLQSVSLKKPLLNYGVAGRNPDFFKYPVKGFNPASKTANPAAVPNLVKISSAAECPPGLQALPNVEDREIKRY